MSGFKHLLPLGLLLGFLSGCSPKITHLTEAAMIRPELYQALLRDTCGGNRRAAAVPETLTAITVYKTSFAERFVEAGSVLQIASLNDSSRRTPVPYKKLKGAREDMYLVQLRTAAACHPEAWVYFSLVSRPSTNRRKPITMQQHGLGTAYLGVPDTINGTLHFTDLLKVTELDTDPGYQFEKKAGRAFFFVADGLKGQGSTVSVGKIVVEEKNKYGGPNAFVFVFAEHFRGDLDKLTFTKINAASLR